MAFMAMLVMVHGVYHVYHLPLYFYPLTIFPLKMFHQQSAHPGGSRARSSEENQRVIEVEVLTILVVMGEQVGACEAW